MNAVGSWLAGAGVPTSRVHIELFDPAAVGVGEPSAQRVGSGAPTQQEESAP